MSQNNATAKELAALIDKLLSERQGHLDAIAEIDATFEQFNIAPVTKKRRGQWRKAAGMARQGKARRRRLRHFDMTANESILAFVRKAGKKGVTSAEIIENWKSEGRRANGYTTIGQLVRARKLKKEKIEYGLGSRYTVV